MSYTTLFTDQSRRIFITTRSEKYIKKLDELGFIKVMYVGGWRHSVTFPRPNHAAGIWWCGTARDFLSKNKKMGPKFALAVMAADKISESE